MKQNVNVRVRQDTDIVQYLFYLYLFTYCVYNLIILFNIFKFLLNY